ncbi:MAG: imidazolonepropionase [Anaerolineales bacterium]|nr:imidazolonepropionase [Anaerolineales bacterium]
MQIPERRRVLQTQIRDVDCVVYNIGQLATVAAEALDGLGLVKQAALAAQGGRIVWIGPTSDWHLRVSPTQGATLIDAQRRLVTPGFVDSHTHLVHAGQRAAEFHQRLSGVDYAAQLAEADSSDARQLRGILKTVHATRAENEFALAASAQRRLRSAVAHGTTTLEIKTGYGLSLAAEGALLNAIGRLQHRGPRVLATFLGAHTVPEEYRDRRAAYVRLVIDEMLPAFAGRADFCDIFVEAQAFSVDEARRILTAARGLGYRLKLHVEQLSHQGGAQLAAELGATSADHLDFCTRDDALALAKAGTVATLLPNCSMTLRTAYPNARLFLEAGCTLALATDYNPGTAPSENMQLVVALAVLRMGLSPTEALRAATLGGAAALGLSHEIGSLEVGKAADLLIWEAEDALEMGYHLGTNRVETVVVGGRVLHTLSAQTPWAPDTAAGF